MSLSEPQATVLWVLVVDSLNAGNYDDAYRVIAKIQQTVEADPASLLPLLELSAYALAALAPEEDALVPDTEREFGSFLRDRLGVPCGEEALRSALRNPAGPVGALSPGLGLNGALYVSFALLGSLARRDPSPAPGVAFAKAALNLRHGRGGGS